jgi:hypothetical protein
MGQAATWKPVATTIVRNVGEVSEKCLPLIFAELDGGRSTKLKERAAQAVLIYNKAMQDGYVSKRDESLFNSARFDLRDVPFRHIDKAYPPVRNPEYKRLSEEKHAASAAVTQWCNHLRSKGIDLFGCKDPQLMELVKVCRKYDDLSEKLPNKIPNPELPKQLFKGTHQVSATRSFPIGLTWATPKNFRSYLTIL